MDRIVCKHCGGSILTKDGLVRDGLQRYLCKTCRHTFTLTPPRGKPKALRTLAVLLCGISNVGKRKIGKLLNVSGTAIEKWIRRETEPIRLPKNPVYITEVKLSKLWKTLKVIIPETKDEELAKPLILAYGGLLPGLEIILILRRSADFGINNDFQGDKFLDD